MRWLFLMLGLGLTNLALPVWAVWWLYNIIALSSGFWGTLGLALLGMVVQASIGVLITEIAKIIK